MGYWIKQYADGSHYKGDDLAVAAKTATWRGSKGEGIIGVDLEHDEFYVSIHGPGEYWQSDTMEALFPGTGQRVVQRRIERRIEQCDLYFIEQSNRENKMTISFNKEDKGRPVPLKPRQVGSWLVLEIDLQQKLIRRYVRSDKF